MCFVLLTIGLFFFFYLQRGQRSQLDEEYYSKKKKKEKHQHDSSLRYGTVKVTFQCICVCIKP